MDFTLLQCYSFLKRILHFANPDHDNLPDFKLHSFILRIFVLLMSYCSQLSIFCLMLLADVWAVAVICFVCYFYKRNTYIIRFANHIILRTKLHLTATGQVRMMEKKKRTGLCESAQTSPDLATLKPYVTTYAQPINTYHMIRTNQYRSGHVGGK